jgi:catechol 2,3-dioxygenase-like lactoylglutathione lyase family enzyme
LGHGECHVAGTARAFEQRPHPVRGLSFSSVARPERIVSSTKHPQEGRNESTTESGREPIFDIAEFSSLELYSPDVDGTLWFFKDLLGMIETGRSGDSVFLRGWHDPYNHSLKVTHRDHAGMGFARWRAMSQPALERRVKAVKDTGLGHGWVDGECGVGDAYEFTLPDGSVQRIHWDIDYYRAPEDQKSVLMNRPQPRPLAGVPVESLDHLTCWPRTLPTTRTSSPTRSASS